MHELWNPGYCGKYANFRSDEHESPKYSELNQKAESKRFFESYIIIISLIILSLNSCTAYVQRTILSPNLRLRNYNNIIANLVTSSGSLSMSTATLGAIDSAHLMEGEKQGILALESLQFEMMSIGFNFVSNENQADAIVDLSIGSIRYDPLAGWIADQAFVKFRDRKSGQVIAFYRAQSQLVTPTVNNIISNLASKIKGDY